MIDQAQLAVAVGELIDGWGTHTPDRSYIGRLEQLLPEPALTLVAEGKTHRRISASPAPWNAQAAGLYTDIHGGCRSHERTLKLLAFSRDPRRSGSDLHTRRVLRELPDLIVYCHQTFPGHDAARRAAADLYGWPRRVRHLLDEALPDEIPLTRAPGNLSCPHCGRRLILKQGWQFETTPDVWCLDCPDQGQTMRWKAAQWIGALQSLSTVEHPVTMRPTYGGSGRA